MRINRDLIALVTILTLFFWGLAIVVALAVTGRELQTVGGEVISAIGGALAAGIIQYLAQGKTS